MFSELFLFQSSEESANLFYISLSLKYSFNLREPPSGVISDLNPKRLLTSAVLLWPSLWYQIFTTTGYLRHL